ncbi:VCBS repeat-containing protein [Roseivirga sp.]|uniref:VCBS repeat-containing protein n=1 Tax=Roseivirga sp. TaxID=1964215 RepID=UPI003B526F75
MKNRNTGIGNRIHAVWLGIFLGGILISSCSEEKDQPALFRRVPIEESGIDFTNTLTESPDFNIIEYLYFYNGGGVAAGDINNDGLIDLYFTANQKPNRLYLNEGNFKFKDITQSSGISEIGNWSTGATMADVNGDGYLDIYLCQVGDYKDAKGRNQLFINNQDGTFTEQAEAYGLDFVGFSTHSAFFDYDNDGDLDLYLLNHSIKNPEVFVPINERFENIPGGDKIYQNQLAQGEDKFIDVTPETGIYSSALGFGLGLGISDINKDGWPDIYVSNDFAENDYLYFNQQDGTFKEQLESHIQHTSRFSMGNFVADINNDAQVDIFTTDMLPDDPEIWKKSIGEDKIEVYRIKEQFGYGDQYVRNTLQLNLGNGMFSDISLFSDNFATDWSWSPLIFDMDNDGLQDIHITNGIYKRPNDLDFVNYMNSNPGSMEDDELEQARINSLPTLKIPNYAGLNKGEGRFDSQIKDMRLGFEEPSYSNGSTYADLDNDGDLDLIINNLEQEVFLYENQSPKTNGYLNIRFKGPRFNAFGIGAKVYVTSYEQMFYRENFNSRGFQSSTSPELHFGLGETEGPVSLEVVWPDGKTQHIEKQEINQTIVIDYNEAEEGKIDTGSKTQTYLSIARSGIDYKHREDEFDDHLREYLLPRKYAHEGPAMAVGDVNGDKLDDIYFGGAKDQPAELWIQKRDGTMERKLEVVFEQLQRAEDISAEFLDVDGDNDLDLYIISGGNEFQDGHLFTYDRIYLNDGQGNFNFSPGALDRVGSQGRTTAIADFDGDSDPDVFVGSNVVAGAYGQNPPHFLLMNNGRGFFQNQTQARMPFFMNLGMINAAEAIDFDADGDMDLVIAGEWTGIQLLQNDGRGVFSLVENELSTLNGWWYSLQVTDINGDGKPDLLAGNLGLNSKLKASKEEPVSLYYSDLDGNGQSDPFIFHFQNGKETPFASRDDLIKQVSAIKKLHSNYQEYAQNSSPEDILGEKFPEMPHKTAVEFRSMAFINQGNGQFKALAMPEVAQLSPVMDMVTQDFNEDGNPDVLLFGNLYGFRTDFGRADAKPITLLLGNGDGTFTPTDDHTLNTGESWGEYRKAAKIELNGTHYIIAIRNNDSAVLLKVNSNQ